MGLGVQFKIAMLVIFIAEQGAIDISQLQSTRYWNATLNIFSPDENLVIKTTFFECSRYAVPLIYAIDELEM